jgi:phosphotransferase system IIB component
MKKRKGTQLTRINELSGLKGYAKSGARISVLMSEKVVNDMEQAMREQVDKKIQNADLSSLNEKGSS